MDRKQLGAAGEKLAQAFLKKRGYRIVETNFRCAEGEADIIARHRDALVFVEVRTKSGPGFGTPEESITGHKGHRMRKVAYRYRQGHDDLPEQWRIDLVAVEMDGSGRVSRIELIENAVTEY